MPKPPEAPIFESEEEREKRKPIHNFTKKEKDPKTGEEFERKMVSVYGIELPVYDQEREGGEGTNFREEEFGDFHLDDKAKEMLKHFATAVKLNHAPLLEGETDIGKTKALEYLAHLTNHKLVRISVRGTTDPTEFFGKHVPESATAQRKILEAMTRKPGLTKEAHERLDQIKKEGRVFSLEDYKALSDLQMEEALAGLQKPTRELFRKAAQKGRGLTKEEWEQLAAVEGIDLEGKMFTWQDGEIVKAMTRNNGNGYWLYIDEVGAGEPQILIALNRILEQYGRIELSEDGGRFVEAGKDFRMFGTTNPPEYAGRIPLAPDFLRRWAYKKESPLDEETIKNRFEFISRELPFEKDIRDLLGDGLTAFYLSLRGSIKNILKKQKQKFNYEFSDLIRVRDYLGQFGSEDPLASLYEAMDYAVFSKIGDDTEREKQRKNFKTLLKSKEVPEKIEKIMEERHFSKKMGKMSKNIEDLIPE